MIKAYNYRSSARGCEKRPIDLAQKEAIWVSQGQTQLCLPYLSFLRVRKPGSNTHPYYFG